MEICRKRICMICLIEMSGTMLGSMPEVVQQAEMPSLTNVCIIHFLSAEEVFRAFYRTVCLTVSFRSAVVKYTNT